MAAKRDWAGFHMGGGNFDDKRPTSRLGMLAWDAREELRQQDGLEPYELAESAMERMANQKIREAFKDGAFNDLPKGLPHKNIEGDIAHHALKNAGVLPQWIKDSKILRKDIASFRKQIAVKYVNSKTTSLDLELKEAMKSLNKRIGKFNRICPVPSAQIFPMTEAGELAKRSVGK